MRDFPEVTDISAATSREVMVSHASLHRKARVAEMFGRITARRKTNTIVSDQRACNIEYYEDMRFHSMTPGKTSSQSRLRFGTEARRQACRNICVFMQRKMRLWRMQHGVIRQDSTRPCSYAVFQQMSYAGPPSSMLWFSGV